MAFDYRNSTNPQTLSIEGERVRLDVISRTFEQDIFKTFDAEVTRYMFPKPAETITEVRAFIDSSHHPANLQFVILDKTTDEFLGCCGLHGKTDSHNPELGIWLKTAAHGAGYGREAIHALVTWAREHLSLDSFVYPVDKNNTPSRAIPLSLGGEVFDERRERGAAGNKLDLVFYRIPA